MMYSDEAGDNYGYWLIISAIVIYVGLAVSHNFPIFVLNGTLTHVRYQHHYTSTD